MIKARNIVLLFCVLGMIACQSDKPKEPAHLRFITMIQHSGAELMIRGKGKHKDVQKTLSLQYSKPTEYQQLSPGYYEITLSIKGKKLLKGTYAMGKNGYYTMLATGLLPETWKVNPQTTMYKLKYIFAGEELHSANKYLPQWFMMRDNYDGNKKSSYIRLVNANPHTPKLSVKKEKKSLKSALAYPYESTMLKLSAGDHNLRFLYGNIMLAEKSIKTKPGYIYTAIIGGDKSSDKKLVIPVLENPSRTLIKSKE